MGTKTKLNLDNIYLYENKSIHIEELIYYLQERKNNGFVKVKAIKEDLIITLIVSKDE